MALVLADRVKETTTTTGTSDFALGGAVSGFQTFSAGVGNSNTTYYSVSLGSDWEVGLGTLSSDGLTLARTTVLQSSNSDTKVSFAAGSKDVFVTYPADKSVLSDSTQTLTNKTLTSPTINSAKINLDFNAQTGTTYTLVASDSSKLVTASNAATITITVPPAIFTAGEQVNVQQIGAGQVNFAAGSGVTITSTGLTSASPNLIS